MPTASELQVRVSAQGVQQASQQLRGLGQQVDRTGQQAGTAGGRFRGMLGPLQQISPVSLGAAGAVGALGIGVKTTTEASIAWESALAGVAKTLDGSGLSTSQFNAAVADIGDELRQMATEIPIAATELAGVAEAAGQLGVAREDVISFTETMAKLGVATDLSAEEAAVALARFTNITGTAAEDVDNLAATIVDLGNNSAAVESEILDMGLRLAGAGDQAGLTEAEILGLAAALTSVGVNAEAGGTAFSRVLIEMGNSVDAADEKLAVFAETAGLSAQQFADIWNSNPREAIIAFVEGLNEVDAAGGNVNAVLEDLGLDGIRVGDSLRRAAGAGDLLRDSMDRGNQAFEDNIALTEEANRRFETTASRLQIARNRMNDAAIAIGDNLTPALADAAEFTASLTEKVGAFIDAIGGTDASMQANIDAIASGAERLGVAVDEFPAPPEEKKNEWGHWISDWLGLGWDDVWSVFDAPEDPLQEFREVIAEGNQLSAEQERALRAIAEGRREHNPLLKEEAELLLRNYEHLQFLASAEGEAAIAISERVNQTIASAFADETAAEKARELAEHRRFLEQNTFELATVEEGYIEAALEGLEAQRGVNDEYHRGVEAAAAQGVAISELSDQYDAATVAAGLLDRSMDDLSAVNQIMNDRIDDSANAISHWEDRVSGVDEALGYLDEQLAAGNITTEEHAEKVGKLEEFQRRLEGGIQDDLIPAFIDEQLAAADLQTALDDLDQALQDGKISEEEHAEASRELREEFEKQSNPIGTLIEKVGELIDTLIELEDQDPEVEISADTSAAHEAVDGLIAAIQSGAVLPVSITTGSIEGRPGAPSKFAHGGISEGGLALVGEEGPELVMLPRGAEVVPNRDTERMLSTGSRRGRSSAESGFFEAGMSAGNDFGAGFQVGVLDAFDPAVLHDPGEEAGEEWGEGFAEGVDTGFGELFELPIFAGPVGAGQAPGVAGGRGIPDVFDAGREFGLEFGLGFADGADETISGVFGDMEWPDEFVQDLGTISEESLEVLEDMARTQPELVEGFIDDIILAAVDGQIAWEDAWRILSLLPEELVLPVLEELEQKLGEDIVAAVFKGEDAVHDAQEDFARFSEIVEGLGINLDAATLEMDEFTDAMWDAEAAADAVGGRIGEVVDIVGRIPGAADIVRELPESLDEAAGGEGGAGSSFSGSVQGVFTGSSSNAERTFNRQTGEFLIGDTVIDPGFATGGFTLGEGLAMLHPNEAVLNPSSQMLQPLADAIVDAIDRRGGGLGMPGQGFGPPIHLHNHINAKEVADEIFRTTLPGMTLRHGGSLVSRTL